MKLNISDLQRLIESVIDETVFSVDSKDPKMSDKINKIKNDSSIFDKTKDKIVIDGENKQDDQMESYTKGEIMHAISEAKKIKMVGKNSDYMKAIKKADRESEYEINGPGWKSKDKVHKDKTKYDRKHDKNIDIEETVVETTVGDIRNKMLENKYNGIVYSGSDFKKKLNESTTEDDILSIDELKEEYPEMIFTMTPKNSGKYFVKGEIKTQNGEI